MSSDLTAQDLATMLGMKLSEAKSHIKNGMPVDQGATVAMDWLADEMKGKAKQPRKAKAKPEPKKPEPKKTEPKKPTVPKAKPEPKVAEQDWSDAGEEEEISYNEAKRRKEVAGALQAELNLAKDREQVANIDDLMEAFSDALVNVRASLTSLSSRMSGMLAHQDEESVRRLIDKEIHDTLDALSNYK